MNNTYKEDINVVLMFVCLSVFK